MTPVFAPPSSSRLFRLTMPVSAPPPARLLLGLALALAGACSSSGRYVWADRYAPPASEAQYTVAPGDLLNVQVWDNEKLSARARVRGDGRVSLPLLDDVPVAGRTPVQVARDVEQRLRQAELVLAPRVNVSLDEAKPVAVSVLGKVARAGSYTLAEGSGVAEALASAGGLNDFADRDRIFVLRRAPAPVRIRFTFGALTGRSSQAALFRLRGGDVVVAE